MLCLVKYLYNYSFTVLQFEMLLLGTTYSVGPVFDSRIQNVLSNLYAGSSALIITDIPMI